MPNGGGTTDRIGATLGEAFVLNYELSSGKRLPAGGRVDFVGRRNLVPSETYPATVEIRFRVVSAAFEGLSGRERASLIHEVLLDGAATSSNRRSGINPHLFGARCRPTGRAEGEFDFVNKIAVIDARTHSEVGEELPRLPMRQAPSGSRIGGLRPSRDEGEPTDRRHLLSNNRQSSSPTVRQAKPSARRPSLVPTEADRGQTAQLRHLWALWILPAVLLMIAILPLPYAYYTFLRLAICAASVFLAYQHFVHQDSVDKWVVLLAAIALLYNPLIPVYLTREIWSVLNVITAAAFILHFVSVTRRLRNSENSDDT